MNICMVNALTISDFGSSDLTLGTEQIEVSAPLGILSLASILTEQCSGVEIYIANLNKLYLDYNQLDKTNEQPSYAAYVVEHLESLYPSFDVLGFSSICSSYPLTLRIATKYKERHKDTSVVLGGPQASVTDTATMKAFPTIDFVIRGEAEHSFISFIRTLSQRDASGIKDINGVTFRQGDRVVRNPDSDIIHDLDNLPFPAYHLDPLITEYKSLSLEVGRGCPFNCTFCSTSNYFGRKFRLKSPQKIIDQMKLIKRTYNVNNIGLDHDMFTVKRHEVEAFCHALLNSGEKFNWGCSARVDCIDNDLMSLMSQAGCRGIFFGIETASPRLQKSINKNLKLTEAVDCIQHADKCGIKAAVSLITAFPDETEDELRETLNFFVESLRFDNAEPQMGILAPLAGSPMYAKYKEKLEFDEVFSEMAFQGWKIDEKDLELIRNNPEVFPDFYSIPNPGIERRFFKDVRDFVTGLQVWFRWIPLAMLQETGDMLKIYRRLMEWRRIRKLDGHLYDGVPYYNHKRFADDFLEFTRNCYIEEISKNKIVISELTKTEGFYNPNEAEIDKNNTNKTEYDNKDNTPVVEQIREIRELSLSSVPFQPENVRIIKVNIDYAELLERLRKNKSLEHLSEKDMTIALREILRGTVQIEVRQLSELSEKLLYMCDGIRTVDDIIHQFSSHETDVNGVPAKKAALYLLVKLFEQGIIDISPQSQKEQQGLQTSLVSGYN
jgi:radical SAM superfamily enzyme YgiQ (UPF0313 family)